MTKPRVLFYVQYLEGIGHVVRAGRIVEELCRQGCAVAFVLGGVPIPGVRAGDAVLHQLPPLRASPTSYSKLLKPDGTLADEPYKSSRRDQLLAVYDDFAPDIVITEAYPMGRWAMHFELEPLLAQAHAQNTRPMILASLRDILQMPKTTEKSEKSIELFERYYDHMLVHGDPQLAKIEESFPPLAHLVKRAHYTGIIAPEMTNSDAEFGETFDVIVSGGGGAIGYDVLVNAIAAKPLSTLSNARWIALSGPRMPLDVFESLQRIAATHGVRLERFRDGLVSLMARAQLSIQRAGYNTVSDLLIAGCRGLLVPDSADQQMEQPLRAAKLQSLGRAIMVSEDDLSPTTTAAGIDQAMVQSPNVLDLMIDGASKTAEIVIELFAEHQAAQNGAEPV